MTPLRTSLFLLVFGTFAAGCGEGPVGPPGPPGPAGGADVFTLDPITFSVDEATFNGSVASVQYDVPAITASVVDNGAVLAFFREQDTWTAMPYTFADESPDLPAVDHTITLGYAFDDNFLELFYEASSEDISLEDQPDRLVKVVIIDALPLAKAGIDLRDYEAVKAYYHLPD